MYLKKLSQIELRLDKQNYKPVGYSSLKNNLKGDYMTIRINNIVLGLDDDIEVVKKRVSKKLKVSIDEIENFKIIK